MHLLLARELGYTGRKALYAALTAEELLEWESLYALDPWGDYRADLRNGLLCSLTDACHRAKGKPGTPISYMPIVEALTKVKPRQSPEQMKAILLQAQAQWGRKK